VRCEVRYISDARPDPRRANWLAANWLAANWLAANWLGTNWLAADPALRRRLGEGGRTRVQALFGVQRMAAAFQDTYEHLAALPRGERSALGTPWASGNERCGWPATLAGLVTYPGT
jgi:hypothetical protein